MLGLSPLGSMHQLLYGSDGTASPIRPCASSGDWNRTSFSQAASARSHPCALNCMLSSSMWQLGAGVKKKDRWGTTPLDDAWRGSHDTVAAYLAAHQEDTSSFRTKRGRSVSKFLVMGLDLCEAASRGDVQGLRELVEMAGSDPDIGAKAVPPLAARPRRPESSSWLQRAHCACR